MPKQTIITELLKRPIAYNAIVAKAFGSVKLGILWSQLYYWHDKGNDPDGWIYKTQSEIFDETGLSRKEQETARRIGRGLGVLEEKLARQPATIHFRIDLLKTEKIIEDYYEKQVQGQIPLFGGDKPDKKPKDTSDYNFEILWKAYHPKRRVAKEKALAKWKLMKPDQETLDKILLDIAERKLTTAWINENGKYLPLITTYINQQRWNDDYKGDKPKQAEKQPFFRGDRMVKKFGKWHVITGGEWKIFAGSENDIEWREEKND